MDTQNRDDADYIAELILAYMLDHLEAQDTLEGIVQWWLTRQHISFQADRVKKVMKRLVREKLIIRVGRMDRREHYRINPARIGHIKKLLEHEFDES